MKKYIYFELFYFRLKNLIFNVYDKYIKKSNIIK